MKPFDDPEAAWTKITDDVQAEESQHVLGRARAVSIDAHRNLDACQVPTWNAERELSLAERIGVLAAERDALHDRLAKLEAALGYAVTQLEAANELLFEEEVRGEEDGVDDMRNWIHETRAGLLNEKGGA